MTDLVNNSSESNIDASQAVQSSAPAPTYTPPSESNNDKLFTQDDVNRIVGKVRAEDKERYRKADQPQPTYQQPNAASAEDIERIAAQKMEQMRNQWQQEAQQKALESDAQRIANEFFTKISTGKDKYQDFDTVTADLEFRSIPQVVQLANMVDNTADVMYDLAKHPTKIAMLQQLVTINPKLAFNEMQRLSNSIKENDKAANTKLPNEPLSQLRPSNTGMDSGEPSMKDLKAKYRA